MSNCARTCGFWLKAKSAEVLTGILWSLSVVISLESQPQRGKEKLPKDKTLLRAMISQLSNQVGSLMT